RDRRRVLVGLHQGAGRVHERRLRARHDLAGDRQPARRRQGADQDDPPEGGRDRVVGHLDDRVQGQAPELHVHVDEPHHLAEGERRGGGVVRRGPGQQEVVRADRGQGPLRDLPRRRRGLLLEGGVLDDAGEGLRRRPRRSLQGLLRVGPGVDGNQGLAASLWRRPRLQLSLLLAGPIGLLGIAYLGSLAVLFLAAFWQLDTFSGKVVHSYGIQNFETLIREDVYRSIVLRTVLIAAAVTVTDALLAFPIAFYMAKVARRRARALLVILIVMPLWSSYLVKVYSWRIILAEDGILNWALSPFGLHGPGFGNVATWLVFSYLWLPYMILPIYAALERIPDSLLDASGDLGGGAGRTVRSVVLPLALPGIVAGSIFTFSLTLGDYITPQIVGGASSQFIGNVVYDSINGAGNLPFGAAFAVVRCW